MRIAAKLGDGNERRNRINQWFLIAVASGLAWRIVRFGLHFELTGDECGIMLSVMKRGYAALLEPLSYSNVSPPMFLWMTKFIDDLFQNEWAARLMPLLAGFGAVAVFGLICREALGGMARWVAWAIFCVAYVPIVEGTRVKGYTIDLLVASAMLWLMLRWLLHGRKARYLVGLSICAPVFVWLSYTAIFVIGAAGLIFTAWLIKEHFAPESVLHENERSEWRNISAGLAFVAVTSVSAILLYKLNVRVGLQASIGNGLTESWQRGYPPDRPWQIPLWLLTTQTGRGFAWPIGDNHFRSTVTFALWLTGLVVYWRRDNRWVWGLFTAPQVLALAAAFLHKYPYLQNPRLCMFLGPGICLFAGRGVQHLIDMMNPEKGRWWYGLTAAALALYAVGGMTRDIVLRIHEIHGPGIRSTLAEASRRLGPNGQVVMLNDGNVSAAIDYYIKREVKQKVWCNGQIPAQTEDRPRLALVAIGYKGREADGPSLIGEFERQFGRPMKVAWTQTAHEVLLDNKDSVEVWVCE